MSTPSAPPVRAADRPSRHRARHRLAAAAAAGLVLLAGCSSGSGTTASTGSTPGGSAATGSGEATTISFLVTGSPDELDAYRAVVDAFEASQPDVRVRLVEASDNKDLMTRLGTATGGGRPPELFVMNYRNYAQLAAKGALRPVAPMLAASSEVQADDFYPQAMDAFRWDGEQLCLPMNISSLVVYYNKDLFEQAGVPLPARGWTWDDMLAAAEALTVDADGDGTAEQYGLGVEPTVIRLAPFVWSNGGDIVDDPAAPTRFTLGTPEAVEATQNFLDLWRVHDVVPSETEFEAEDNESRFANGKMAMVMQSRKSVPFFRTIDDFAWDVAPLPVYDEEANVLHSDGFCLTEAGEHPDAAWRFMEFALGPQGAPILSRTGRTVPSLRSVAESDAFLDPSKAPASAQVWLDNVPTIRPVPVISTWPEVEDAVDLEIEIALWREQRSAEELAVKIDEATADPLARAER